MAQLWPSGIGKWLLSGLMNFLNLREILERMKGENRAACLSSHWQLPTPGTGEMRWSLANKEYEKAERERYIETGFLAFLYGGQCWSSGRDENLRKIFLIIEMSEPYFLPSSCGFTPMPGGTFPSLSSTRWREEQWDRLGHSWRKYTAFSKAKALCLWMDRMVSKEVRKEK